MIRDRDAEVLQLLAACLNGPFRDVRWRFCEEMNRRLERTDCDFVLFDHAGVVDVGVRTSGRIDHP